MESHLPFVSVIVPVYNGQATVVQCVESLLAQSYPSDRFEIIVVDNGSKDRTTELLQPFAQSGKIRLLSETQVLNAYGARNTGAKAARGEFFAFTDADCEAESNWIDELVKSFSDPSIGCVAGEVLPAYSRNVIEKYWDQDLLTLNENPSQPVGKVLGANCAYPRAIFEHVGGFLQDVPSGGDAELACRMFSRTGLKVQTNLDAVVRHHNVSSVSAFVKQSMRYGTHIMLRGRMMQANLSRPSAAGILYVSIIYTGSFIKRLYLYCIKRLPSSVQPADKDIYLWRPCLRILYEWVRYFGFRIAVNMPWLLR